MPTKIEISRRTIVFTVFFLIGLGFLFYIRDLLLQLFLAVLVMTILDPVVNFFARFKIPRALAVGITYLLIIGAVVILILNIAPPLVEQSTNFVNGLPVYIKSLGLSPNVGDRAVEDFLSQVGILPAHFAKFALSTFTNVIEVITVLIFAFYLLISREKLPEQIAIFAGESKKAKITQIINRLENALGGWARGQMFLMLVVGVFSYIGFKLLGLPFALPLAILAGLLEIVPYVGPIIAAIPAVIIGFGMGQVIGFAAIAVAFLIQQVENYFFVPTIMQKSVGLSSLVILLSLGIGFRLVGVLGAIVSIPAVLVIIVLAKEFNLTSKTFS